MRDETSTLSMQELDYLRRLTSELCRLRRQGRALVARLETARKPSVRALVRDRLLCVLHDSLGPAVQDLDSIQAAACATKRETKGALK